MTVSADNIKKRLAELKKEVPRRGLDRHASILKNVLDLPIELRSTAVIALASREAIDTIIMFPQQIQRGWEYVAKQALLFTATRVTHLLASIWPGQEPQITSLEGGDLIYMKIQLVLLYGSLEIVAQGESEPVQLGMEFNTVSWHHLWKPLQRLLQASQPAPISPAGEETSSPIFERALKELPLKFSNGLQLYGLLPGEELEEVVFQPGTSNRWLYLFQKPVSANTMLLLTSHYMVVITEEMYVRQGWHVSYIPRNNIIRMQSQPCGLWNELSVQLKRGDQRVDYKLKLKNEAVDDWGRGWVQHGGEWKSLPEAQV